MKECVIMIVLLLVLCSSVFSSLSQEQQCKCNMNNASTVKIVDMPDISSVLTKVRDDFLVHRAVKAFTNLQSAILIPTQQTVIENGNVKRVWLRGSVNGTVTQYPASCVKLNYMLAAIEWCKQNNKPINCLDQHVRPMIVYSDNVETGFVVDAVTETRNIPDLNSTSDPRWQSWINKRMYAQNLLQKLELLDNEVVLSKTYPTNSGGDRYGAEKLLVQEYGMNQMQPCCAASLMLHVMNELTEEETDYAKTMLFHRRNDNWSPFGYGLPPGTILWDKSGDAYDTVEDIARIVLPNNQEFILVAFSNGLQRETDFGVLGMFAEKVIDAFGFLHKAPGPAIVTLTADMKSNFTFSGAWKINTDISGTAPDRIGQTIYTVQQNQQANFYWTTYVPAGFYEISIYIPTVSSQSSTITVSVKHAYGTEDTTLTVAPSRWNKIGDYILVEGLQNQIVTIKSSGDSTPKLIVSNAVRFAQYPDA
jgi:hypothetical protein